MPQITDSSPAAVFPRLSWAEDLFGGVNRTDGGS